MAVIVCWNPRSSKPFGIRIVSFVVQSFCRFIVDPLNVNTQGFAVGEDDESESPSTRKPLPRVSGAGTPLWRISSLRVCGTTFPFPTCSGS